MHYYLFELCIISPLPVCRRRYPHSLGEQTREIVLVVDAQFQTYLVNLEVCIFQQLTCSLYLQPVEIGEGTHARMLLEEC